MADWLTKTILSGVGSAIDGWAWLSGEANGVVVNQAVNVTRNRPHPWSTASDYTSWRSLTDRSYFARHLPAATVPVMPDVKAVQALFKRPAGQQRLSDKSTCLFPAFAQYLTDGFIRTVPTDPTRTTTNHEIDLCPLYGRTIEQTNALRVSGPPAGQFGRLKSQMINGEEYSPFLFPNGVPIPDPQFDALDWPLLVHAQTIPPSAGTKPTDPPWPNLPAAQIASLFAVGGDRVNTTPFGVMLNTLLLREHNRIAGELEARNPTWDDERVFQTARNIMIPIFIKIVVEQYINHATPLPFALHADPTVAWTANWNRPNWIAVEFSLLYRWHSLMPDAINWPGGPPIPLKTFFKDNRPLINVGLEAAFAAAAAQPAAELGAFNTADALLDVEILAVLQSRLNRLDTYNNYRVAYGMDPATRFDQISTDPAVAALLETLYGTPDAVEFYPGLFAEDRIPDSPLPGLLLRMVAVDAFSQALTNPLLSAHVFNADTFTPWGLDLINNTHKLGDILERQNPNPARPPIEMTQAGWTYVKGR
jgi:prostaglandin-endoperoxide synthase 2